MTKEVHGIFCRFETFALVAAARKTGGNTFEKVVSEAMRVTGFCDHVQCPTSPNVIYGESPLLLLKVLQERTSNTVNLYWHRQSKKYRTRRQRLDRPIAVAGVISVPPDWKESELRWQQFKDESIGWLVEQFGESRLRSVVEHLDENCLHLHVFLVPLEGEDLGSVHPGQYALRNLGTGASPRDKKGAYQSAMRALLDDFHERVGIRFGMVRKHIGAKRMTRRQWHIWKWYRNQEQQRKELSLEKVVAVEVSRVASTASVVVRPIDADSSNRELSLALSLPSGGSENEIETYSDGLSGTKVCRAAVPSATRFLVSGRKANTEGFLAPFIEDLPAPDYVWVRPRQV